MVLPAAASLVLAVLLITSSGPEMPRLIEALIAVVWSETTEAVFVAAPATVAFASTENVCVPPPLVSEARCQITVPFVFTDGAEKGEGDAAWYVNPAGNGSVRTRLV